MTTAIDKAIAALESMSAHYSGSLDYQPPYVKLGREALAELNSMGYCNTDPNKCSGMCEPITQKDEA